MSYDTELESLDLFMEVLRITHTHPGLSVDEIFEKTTLAMDKKSCQEALNSLVIQGLIISLNGCYSAKATGIQTIIPTSRNVDFPSLVTKTHVDYVNDAEVVPATIHLVNYGEHYKLTKQGVSIELTFNEMRQLWKKLQREYGCN